MAKKKQQIVDPLTALVTAKRTKASVQKFKKAARSGKTTRVKRGLVFEAQNGTGYATTALPELKKQVAAEYIKENQNMAAVSRNLKLRFGTVHTLVRRDAECMNMIREILGQVAQSKVAGIQEVLEILTDNVRSNIDDYMEVNDSGELVWNLVKATRGQLGAISFLEQEEEVELGGVAELDKKGKVEDKSLRITKIKLRLHNKLEAAKLLGQYHKMWGENPTGGAGNQPPPALHIHFTDEPGAPKIGS